MHAVARSAATTIVARQNEDKVQVLMLRRSLQASFMPGSYVFPGGGVDEADASSVHLLDGAEASRSEEDWGGDLPTRLHVVAALRECFEECGLWLGCTVGHESGARLAALRALHAGAASFAQVIGQLQLRIEPGRFHPWAHWVTPIDMPKRFDTWFFVAQAPRGQDPVEDGHETTHLEWVCPREALAACSSGRFPMESPLSG